MNSGPFKRLLAVIAVALILAMLVGCTTGVHEYQIGDSAVLTEQEALELARRALKDEGLDVSRARPVPYRGEAAQENGERFFARNATNPNRGLVSWQINDESPGYSVEIDRDGQVARCRVTKAK